MELRGRLSRSRTARRVAGIGITVIALVGCAALLPDGFFLVGRPGTGRLLLPSVSPWTAWLLVGLLVIGAVLSLSIAETSTPTARSRRRAPWWANLLAVVLALFIAASWGRIAETLRDRGADPGRLAENLRNAVGSQSPPEISNALGVLLIMAIVLAIVGLIAVGLLLFLPDRGRRGRLAPAGGEPEDAPADAVDSALSVLTDVRDPRSAVIASYATLERMLRQAGVRKRGSDTPYEFLERALRHRDVSKSGLQRLTDLFEIARFSKRTVDEDMRDEAAAHLNGIREELRER